MTKESETLAERLRSLYKLYNCEHELPSHNDLVAKLEDTGSEVRQSFQQELDKGEVYPLSLEESLKHTGFSKSCINFYATVFLAYPSLGLKVMPFAFKEAFLKKKEEKAKELMESYNHHAKAVFQEFKEEVRYELDEEFRKKVDSGLYGDEL